MGYKNSWSKLILERVRASCTLPGSATLSISSSFLLPPHTSYFISVFFSSFSFTSQTHYTAYPSGCLIDIKYSLFHFQMMTASRADDQHNSQQHHARVGDRRRVRVDHLLVGKQGLPDRIQDPRQVPLHRDGANLQQRPVRDPGHSVQNGRHRVQ